MRLTEAHDIHANALPYQNNTDGIDPLVPLASDEHLVVDGLTINTEADRIRVGKDLGVWTYSRSYQEPNNSEYSYIVTTSRELRNVGSYTDNFWWPFWSPSSHDYEDQIWDDYWRNATPKPAGVTPYIDQYKALQDTGSVTKVRFYDEKVTFHNVKVIYGQDGATRLYVTSPQIVKTKSGYLLSLVTLNKDEVQNATTMPSYDVGCPFLPDVETKYRNDRRANRFVVWLPNSPLCQEYHKPVEIEYMTEQTFDKITQLCEVDSADQMFNDGLKKRPAEVKDITVTVRQIVKLKQTPYSLTIPFHDDMSSISEQWAVKAVNQTPPSDELNTMECAPSVPRNLPKS